MSQVITDYFQETRGALLRLIEGLSFEQFNATPNEEKWSVAQVCHHLALFELATIKAVKYGLREDNSTKSDPKDIKLILDRSKKAHAPKVVEPGGGPFELQEMVDMLRNTRKKLHETMDSLEDCTVLNEKSVVHPRFGLLSLHQWVETVPLHEQRHIEQIKEIMGRWAYGTR
ncbi:DinB family protein [Ornithinibacillus sp. BX22]|uniref:DinB family protein n=2 Tax=Ornithinibacillus TaxID=484508 RepID=A0A923L7Q7_9BACI|nr:MULTISPECIES: DinB family protein [Ornithinibacillus]MBC5638103.1 DinB family protein [Ornithinibacillus hominis]MBS3680826.1 DinB family protein [Ornithinibacillus massiliensis]